MKKIDDLKNENGEIDVNGIKQIIPYDYPFLMIDKVLSLDKKKIVAIKSVSANEEYFKGHFVGFPILPGALMVEGIGQAATLLVRYNIENHYEKEILAYKIKETKFSAPVFPGETMKYEVALMGQDERGALLQGKISVDDKTVAECSLMLAVVDRKQFRSKYSSVYK